MDRAPAIKPIGLRICVLGITAAFGVLSFVSTANAAVIASISTDTNCGGSTTANFAPGGASIPIKVCISTDTEKLCGVSYRLKVSSAAFDGHFQIASRTASTAFNELTPAPLPQSVVAAPAGDLGAAPNPQAPIPAGPNQLIATLSLAPQVNATNPTYTLSLDSPFSVALVDQDNGCGANGTDPIESPLSASIALSMGTPPEFTSPAAATFTVGFSGTFQVSASGTPTPTLSHSGAFPSGVSFIPATGLISGTPLLGSVGSYSVTFTASNGNLPNASQSFTLTVQKANQALNFDPIANRNFSATPFAVTATSSLGGAYPVQLSSATASTCSVAANNVTMLAAGTCTIVATQAGDANYNPASVSRSFQILAVAPGAPTIGTATAGIGSVTVSFSGPAFTGGVK